MKNKRHETILATREDEEIFVNALVNTKQPNEALKKAFAKYKSQSKNHCDCIIPNLNYSPGQSNNCNRCGKLPIMYDITLG